MKRVICFVATALILTACGSKQKSSEESAARPSVTPTELTASKDKAFQKHKNFEAVSGKMKEENSKAN